VGPSGNRSNSREPGCPGQCKARKQRCLLQQDKICNGQWNGDFDRPLAWNRVERLSCKRIPIIPAGHPREYSLPDCLDWRSAIIEASSSSMCMDGSFIRDHTLKVTHSVTVSCVSERDAWFWQKLFVGCVCIAGGVILILHLVKALAQSLVLLVV